MNLSLLGLLLLAILKDTNGKCDTRLYIYMKYISIFYSILVDINDFLDIFLL